MQAQAGPAGPAAVEHLAVLPAGHARDTEFAAFVRSTSPELGRVAWFLAGDRTRADDLLQHAYLRTWSHWSRVRDGDPLAYARRVLVNARIDAWRSARREVLAGGVPDAGVPSGTGVTDERDALVRALRTLPERQRRIVVLRHLAGLTEAEVADELGVSLGTVKAAASRGLARLRTVLGDDEGGGRP